jgi:hemerythrin
LDIPQQSRTNKEHQHFFAKLDSIERLSLKETAKIEIVDFMQDWLATHILVNDRAMQNTSFPGHRLSGLQMCHSRFE